MNESIHSELLKLQDELQTLDKAAKHIAKAEETATSAAKSTEALQQETSTILEGFRELRPKTQHLIEHIDKIDFPSRLEKLDLSVGGINQGVQNALMRIETLERNVKDEIKAQSNYFSYEIKRQHSEIRLIKLLLFSLMLMALGILWKIYVIF